MFNNLISKIKKAFHIESIQDNKSEGVRKKDTPHNKNKPKKRRGDYSSSVIPSKLVGADNTTVINWVADKSEGLDSKEELERLGKIFAKWLNSKKTEAGKPIATNTKRDLLVWLKNEIRGRNVMRLGLADDVNELAAYHPSYATRIKKLLVKDVSTEYEQAATIGKHYTDLLKDMQADGATEAYDDLLELDIDSHIIAWLNNYAIPKAELSTAKTEREASLEKKHQNLATIRYADMKKIISYGLSDDNTSYGRLAVALALATGRRSIELLHTGDFAINRHAMKGLIFSGQAKKRKGIIADTYPIYCIGCEPQDVINGIEKLRNHKQVAAMLTEAGAMPAHRRNRFIKHRSHSARLEAVQVAFNYDLDRTFKDCRAIYLKCCIDKKKPVDQNYKNISDAVFAKDLAGHNSIHEQLHYQDFIVDYKSPASSKKSPPEKFKHEYQGDSSTPFDDLDTIIEDEDLHKRTKTALLALNAKVKQYAKENPQTKITKTLVLKKIGVSKSIADKYLGAKTKAGKVTVGLAEGIISEYNKSISKKK